MVKSASYKTLLKSSMEILGPTLRELINSSITTGVIYPSWKQAIIRPKLKRQNLDPTLANHWPLSNFSFISKLSWEVTVNQLLDHLNTQYLFPSMQSAYRRHHSTETTLLKVKKRFAPQHESTACNSYRLSWSQFCVWYCWSLFGISETALSLKSYLSDRKQYVSVNGVSSSDYELKYRVPQGSCLWTPSFHTTHQRTPT